MSLKWMYGSEIASQMRDLYHSDERILEIFVYGLSIAGAEKVEITLSEEKHVLETPYVLLKV